MKVLIFVCLQVALVLGDTNNIHKRELPPLNGCEPPTCEICDVFFPHVNPELFWQCVGGFPIERQCAPGTWFSYRHQVCVFCEDWENPCGIDPPTSTSRPTTQTPPPTTTTTTTVPPTTTTTTTVPPPTTTTTTQPPTTTTTTTPAPSPTTEFPSSIESTFTTPGGKCDEPLCNPSAPDRTFFPHPVPTNYWQCMPGFPEALLMSCIEGNYYSDRIKACVDPILWENPCEIPTETTGTTGGTTPTPTPTTTGTFQSTQTSTPWTKPSLPPLENCDEPRCEGSDIFILWPHIDPTKFYQCAPHHERGWAPKIHNCPAPLLFSYEEQVCAWEYQWENPCGVTRTSTTPGPGGKCTEPVCNPLAPERTFYPNPEPTKYWQCIPGYPEALLMACISGKLYSDRLKACVDPALWEDSCGGTGTTVTRPTETSTAWTKPSLPPLEHCDEPSCQGSGIFILWPHIDPTKFYQCAPDNERGWAPKIHNCPAPLLFSYDEQVCVWPYQWENPCGVATTPTTPRPEGCLEPVCNPLAPERTFYPNPDPTKYWQCIPGYPEALLMSCIANNYYSDRIKACVDPALWENPCKIETTPTAPATTTTTTQPPTTTTTTQPPTTTTTTQPPTTTTTTQPPTTTTTTQPPTTTTTTQSSTSSFTTEFPSSIESTVTPPPPGTCEEPDCTDCYVESLHPAWDPHHYWQCVPGWQKAFYRDCPEKLFFSDHFKVCVYCHEWENPCNVKNVTGACSFDNPIRNINGTGNIWEAITGFFN